MQDIVLDQCPRCQSIFDHTEIDAQKCSCCGWQHITDMQDEKLITYYGISKLSLAEVKIILGALLKEKQSMSVLLAQEPQNAGYIKEQLAIIDGLIQVIEKYNK